MEQTFEPVIPRWMTSQTIAAPSDFQDRPYLYESGAVIDGYYPVGYRQSRDGREFFHVIDYKSVVARYPGPNIISQEYDWDELEQRLG